MFLVVSLPKFKRKSYREISWEEYWGEQKKESGPMKGPVEEVFITAASVFATTMSATPVQASVKNRIIEACWPIVDLLQGASYPIAYIMISAGVLLVIVGQRSKGLNMIKWAAVGYITMQFVPSIMQILVEVGDSMKQ